MIAGERNITIDQGADWIAFLQCLDADGNNSDLTGYTAVNAYIGSKYRDTNAVTIISSYLTTSNTTSATGTTSGRIRLFIDDAVTSALSWGSGKWEVDVVEPSGNTVRLFRGKITIRPEVSV